MRPYRGQSHPSVAVSRQFPTYWGGGRGGVWTVPEVEVFCPVKGLSEFIFLRPYRGPSHPSVAVSRQFPTYWGGGGG